MAAGVHFFATEVASVGVSVVWMLLSSSLSNSGHFYVFQLFPGIGGIGKAMGGGDIN